MNSGLDANEYFAPHPSQDFLHSLNDRREFSVQELQCFDGISSAEVHALRLPREQGSETRILKFAFMKNDGGVCLLYVDFLHGHIIVKREAKDSTQNECIINDIVAERPSFSPAAIEMYHTLQRNSISHAFDGKALAEALEEVETFHAFGMSYFPEIIFVDNEGNLQLVERQQGKDGSAKSTTMRLTGDNTKRLKKILARKYAYWSTNAYALRTELNSAKNGDNPPSIMYRVKNAIWNLLSSPQNFEDSDDNPYRPPRT